MSQGLNCFGVGRAGAEPELSYVGSGTPLTQLNVAFRRSYKKGDEWKEATSWIRIKAWGKLAERLADKVKSGTLIFCEGMIEQESWEDKGGNKRSRLVMNLRDFHLVDIGKGNGTGSKPASKPSSPARKQEPEEGPPINESEEYDDHLPAEEDIPF